MSYRIFIQHDWSSTFSDVWILYDQQTRVSVMGLDGVSMYDIERGGKLGEPSFRAPTDLLIELVRAAAKDTPTSDATRDHLKDAIVVRDKLLNLVLRAAFPPRVFDVNAAVPKNILR